MSRTAVVVNLAAPLSLEEQLAARRLCGVLVGRGAELFIAEPRRPNWQIGIRGHRFSASAARPLRAQLIEGALSSGRTPGCSCGSVDGPAASPAAENAWLAAAGGASPSLAAALTTGHYDAIVVLGISSMLTVGLLEEHLVPVVVAPLRLPPLQLFPRTAAALEAADMILVFSGRDVVRVNQMTTRPATDLGYALDCSGTIPAGRPHTAPEGEFVLALGDWSDPLHGPALLRRATRLARALALRNGPRVVTLTSQFIHPQLWPPQLAVRPAASRRDVWQWMGAATAVIDLNLHAYLGLDVAEAVLRGAVAMAGAETAAADHLGRCGGGFPYRNLHDAVTLIDSIAAQPSLRDELTSEAILGARDHFHPRRFEKRVADAIDALPKSG